MKPELNLAAVEALFVGDTRPTWHQPLPIDHAVQVEEANQPTPVSGEPLERYPDEAALDGELPWYDGLHGHDTKHLVAMQEFVRRVVHAGEALSHAAVAVGWAPHRGAYVARYSQAFARARAHLLADDNQQMLFDRRVERDTLSQGVLQRNRIVHESENEELVARVAADSMDRVGWKAPTKIEQRVDVVLDSASQQLLAKMLREAPALPAAVDLERGPFGYALRKPRELLAEVSPAEAARQELEKLALATVDQPE